jgi:ElaB/YqjD/DUF883 family membrane-anchored ribosome-binding protein
MSRKPLDSEKDDTQRSNNFGERSIDTTEKLKDKIEDITARAKDKAGQWTDAASQTADQQRENISTGLDRAASTLHDKAKNIPGGPGAVNAAHRVADGMEATASYLRQHDFADMRDDLVNVCRRHPVQALISAVAIGFFLGRSVRR